MGKVFIHKDSSFTNNPFVQIAWERTRNRNQNLLVAFVGGTGSGKSYAALRAAELIDPDFDADRIVFTTKEFLSVLRQDLPAGSVIIYDEAGVGFSSRQWYTQMNKVLGYVLQTFRFKNYVVFFTQPDFSFLDAQGRKIFHMLMVDRGINKSSRTSYFAPKMIDIKREDGTMWLPFLTYKDENGKTKKCPKIGFKLPNHELIKAYEAKRKKYAETLYEDAEAEIGSERKKLAELTDKEMMVWTLKSTMTDLTPKEMAKMLNITEGAIKTAMTGIDTKGFTYDKSLAKDNRGRSKKKVPEETEVKDDKHEEKKEDKVSV